MTETRTFVASGTAAQSQRLIISTAEGIDELQATGEWIASADPEEVQR